MSTQKGSPISAKVTGQLPTRGIMYSHNPVLKFHWLLFHADRKHIVDLWGIWGPKANLRVHERWHLLTSRKLVVCLQPYEYVIAANESGELPKVDFEPGVYPCLCLYIRLVSFGAYPCLCQHIPVFCFLFDRSASVEKPRGKVRGLLLLSRLWLVRSLWANTRTNRTTKANYS